MTGGPLECTGTRECFPDAKKSNEQREEHDGRRPNGHRDATGAVNRRICSKVSDGAKHPRLEYKRACSPNVEKKLTAGKDREEDACGNAYIHKGVKVCAFASGTFQLQRGRQDEIEQKNGLKSKANEPAVAHERKKNLGKHTIDLSAA